MNNPETQNLLKNKPVILSRDQIALALISLCALIITFLVANSSLAFTAKIAVFISTILVYLFCSTVFYQWQKRRLSNLTGDPGADSAGDIFDQEIEMKLLALEEANEFFGASLKPADMFRLVSSRIAEIIPFASSTLFLAVEDKTKLKAIFADGENAERLARLATDLEKNSAGRAFVSRTAQLDEKLLFDKSISRAGALKGLNSAVSVPLLKDAEVFGVLTLYGKTVGAFDADSLHLLEAIGTRVAPLFLSSFAFEKSLVNALTDSLTNLPNERAFYLILENKIAESQRFRETRPLSLLTFDIKDFSKLNQKYGHAAGDRILEFAGKTIKQQLREMDFLARSAGDEFLAVLPTADEKITEEIVARIEKAFISNQFSASRQEKINLALNFGAATFWKDGETVSQLLQHAHTRKKQSKSNQKGNVLWFPKELVN